MYADQVHILPNGMQAILKWSSVRKCWDSHRICIISMLLIGREGVKTNEESHCLSVGHTSVNVYM